MRKRGRGRGKEEKRRRKGGKEERRRGEGEKETRRQGDTRRQSGGALPPQPPPTIGLTKEIQRKYKGTMGNLTLIFSFLTIRV